MSFEEFEKEINIIKDYNIKYNNGKSLISINIFDYILGYGGDFVSLLADFDKSKYEVSIRCSSTPIITNPNNLKYIFKYLREERYCPDINNMF